MTDDPIPTNVRDVLALFAGELREHRFGDLDASSLEALAERTRAAALDVERARAALDEAHALLSEARDALAKRAEQALAYAKVFAETDEALATRLREVERPEPPKRRAPKRRAPKRRAPGEATTAAELPFEARGAA
jgi:hypothetical protein